MDDKYFFTKMSRPSSLIASLGFAVASANCFGAAFMLNEQNVSGLGNAYAGRTAIAEDASTNFFNPAGLVLLNNHQVVGAVSLPLASFEMTPNLVTRQRTATTSAQVVQGKVKQDAGATVPIPAFHVAGPLFNNFYYGFSVTAPFGLKTEYSKYAQSRYFGTKSELKTIDANPNIAYKIDKNWSVGGGVSVQYAQAKLNSQVDANQPAGALPGAAENIDTDGEAHNKADNIGFGYNFGVMYQANNSSRVGLHFRSKIKHPTEGEVRIAFPGLYHSAVNPAALGLVTQKAKATVTLPEVLALSSFQTINSEWDIMADLTLTRWERFKKLVIKYPDTRLPDSRVEEKFKNTFKASIGANYKYNKQLTWRFGAAFDDSPVQSKHRNIRIPDSDRIWLATGVKYVHNKNFTVDAGYTYIFVKDASVREHNLARPLQTINADYESYIHLFGIQGAYNLV